jgi:hypothetical protein
MSWLDDHKRVWRLVMLGLVLVAFVGPWAFDLINVPSEFSCSAPFIRLQGDYCGTPVSGIAILPAFVGGFVDLVVQLVTGSTAIVDLGRRFLFVLVVLLLLLPLFSTLLLTLPGSRQRRQPFHLLLWGLATLSVVWWLRRSPAEWLPSQVWGLWLYAGLAPSMLILEGALSLRGRLGHAR